MFMTMIHAGERRVAIPATETELPGILTWPAHPSGVILFAHDLGSGQFCPHDAVIANRLRSEGLATLRFDLLTPREAGNPATAFDVALLARRLRSAAAWLGAQPETRDLPIGLFGTGLGAAAAMIASAEEPGRFAALATYQARTDLAEFAVPVIQEPALLLVGERDRELLKLTRAAMKAMTCSHRLVVVPGAARGFETRAECEPVAGCAAEWFVHHLAMEPAWHAPVRGAR